MDDFTLYKIELKKWYEKVKNGENAIYLLKPGQAGLRNLCVSICRNGKAQDLITFRNFLGFDFDEGLLNRIKSDTDKFKPIAKFLKEESSLADMASAEMLAMLIGFEKRPIQKFIANKNPTAEPRVDDSDEPPVKPDPSVTPFGLLNWKWIFGGAIVVVVSLVIVALSLIHKSGCMIWKNDHYESIDCQSETNPDAIRLYSAKQFPMRKIQVSAKTAFFNDGKVAVWYLKHGGKYDFFDRPGFHPVLETKKLNPVSRHIAMEVVAGNITSSE